MIRIRISGIFWDIPPSSPLKVNRRFGVSYRLHLQGRRISRVRNHRGSKWQATLHDSYKFKINTPLDLVNTISVTEIQDQTCAHYGKLELQTEIVGILEKKNDEKI
jgi:hypothetical protein